MLPFVHSPSPRSKWCLTCRLSRWRRWLQSALAMLCCSRQKKSKYVTNSFSNMHFYLCIFNYTACLNNNVIQPKEKNKAGDILGDTEKTSTDKMRDRRHKKTVKRIKIKEKEKRQKLKEASGTGENRKLSKAEVAENLKKLTKGGKTKILKVGGFSRVVRTPSALLKIQLCTLLRSINYGGVLLFRTRGRTRLCGPLKPSSLSCRTKLKVRSKVQRTRLQRRRNTKKFL